MPLALELVPLPQDGVDSAGFGSNLLALMAFVSRLPLTPASQWFASVLSTFSKDSSSAAAGLVDTLGCSAKTFGRVSMTYCDTCSPIRPCPSKTPKRPVACSCMNG